MTDYEAVLTAEYPGRAWSISGNDYSTLVMHDDGPKPTKATLDSKWAAVELARNTKQIEQARRARYQTETDGLFFAAQREGGDLTAWQAAVDAIKADLPYPEEPK
jgi:hypothetical protein